MKALLFETEPNTNYYKEIDSKYNFKDEIILQIINPIIERDRVIENLKQDQNIFKIKIHNFFLLNKIHIDNG